MLEVEYSGPRVAEVGCPGDACRAVQCPCNQVHGVRRPGTDDGIHRMLAEVFFQKSDGGTDPQAAGVGYEDVGPEPEGQAHHRGLAAHGVDGVDGSWACLFPTTVLLSAFLCPLAAGQRIEYCVWLQNGPLDDLRLRTDIPQQRLVCHSSVRVRRSVDDRLPAVLRQIFGHLEPPLHAGTGCRWPVIRYNQHPFHFSHFPTNILTIGQQSKYFGVIQTSACHLLFRSMCLPYRKFT